jgi:hypothetical protein
MHQARSDVARPKRHEFGSGNIRTIASVDQPWSALTIALPTEEARRSGPVGVTAHDRFLRHDVSRSPTRGATASPEGSRPAPHRPDQCKGRHCDRTRGG